MPDTTIEVHTSPKTILADLRSVEIETTKSKTVEVSRKINYVSDKIMFSLGTTNNAPLSTGDKQAYGTWTGNGTITQWIVTTDDPTTAVLKVQRSSSFPTFSDIIIINMTNESRASGYVDIALLDMDVLNIYVVSNSAASKFVVELIVR